MSPALQSPQAKKWRVVAEGPGGRTKEFVVENEALVGRDPSCDLCLEGRKISRRHFSVSTQDNNLALDDLGSHNGTLVTGKRVSKSLLTGGEEVQAGEWTLRFLPDRRNQIDDIDDAPVITDDFVDTDLTVDITSPIKLDKRKKKTVKKKEPDQWQWDKAAPNSASQIRLMPIADNPLVQKLRSPSNGQLDISSFGNFKDVARSLDTTPSAESIENLALQLLYRVMAESSVSAKLEDFLGKIADAILDATQAQGVAVLLPDGAFGEMTPRVIRLAERANDLQLSHTVVDRAIQDRAVVAAANAAADNRFASGESIMRLDLRAVLCVPLLRDDEVEGVLYLTRERPYMPAEHDLVGALGHLVGLGIEQARLREQVQAEASLRAALERFHTPEVVEKIILSRSPEQHREIEPFLEPMEATIIFADLSGFTAFSERTQPAQVAELLNAYLGRMTEVVFQHRGTVDKYIGDAIMAIFGAPFAGPDDVERAVACALSMRSAFSAMIAERPPKQRLRLRIGVNTGPVVAGLIGSQQRMEYTALGDTVNVAARLEETAEPGQILIGPLTMKRIGRLFLTQSCGAISLKGKAAPVEAYEVIGSGPISGPSRK